jgi:virginiamycin B lyase
MKINKTAAVLESITLILITIMLYVCNVQNSPTTVSNSVSEPGDITAGSDGNIWFTDVSSIGKISPKTGRVTEYPINIISDVGAITAGPDGNLWFTETMTNRIDNFSPTNGTFTDYSVPTLNAFPDEIATSPDGNLWFTEQDGNKISKISPQNGLVTEYITAKPDPRSITIGPDGNLWFIDCSSSYSSVAKICKISPKTGVITEYNVPNPGEGITASPFGITTGSDGNVWFTDQNGSEIDSISPATGAITKYNVSSPGGITDGPDDNLWFVTGLGIAKISPINGKVTEYTIPNFSP